MNEFTLTELRIILADMDAYVQQFSPLLMESQIHLELRTKVQGMIDNYCEHEWRCFDDEHNTRECIKCSERQQGEFE